MTKKVKMGKIKLPMDVRDSKDIPAFENMLSGGPMAVVLVYADWCGHCDTYKKNVWSPLKSTKGRSVNLASVHHDQLENTSLKGSKIDGYPSILVVGKDKKPALFNSNSGVTNAMPNTNEVSTMKKLITTPVPKEITSDSKDTEFKPTFENEPIEEGTDISLPSIKASMNNDKPMNSREKELLEDFRKNTNLYLPKNNSANNSVNSSPISLNSNARTNNSLNTGANSVNNSLNSSPISLNTGANSVNNSAKTLTSLENSANLMDTNNISATTQENNSTLNFDKGTPTATETNPPLIEEDEVENQETTSPNLAPANSQGSTPLSLSGGRLFRRLTHKKRKTHKPTKKQIKRKN
jgi:thiol-disulfide isomerase/thioredoxin